MREQAFTLTLHSHSSLVPYQRINLIRAQGFAAIQKIQFGEKAAAGHFAPHALNQATGCRRRAARCQQVVNHQNTLSGLDGVGVHFYRIRAVLQRVLFRDPRAGQFAQFAQGHKADIERERKAGSER